MLRRVVGGMTSKGIKGQLLRAAAGGFGVRVLSLFATLLMSVVLVRVLGDDSYGIYVFALSVTALLALPVQAGTPLLVIREIASADTTRDWVALHSIRAWALRVNVLFGLMIMVGVLLFTWVAGDQLTQETRHVFWLAAALILPMALTSTFSATLRGLRWVMSGLYPGEVLRPLLISAFVGALAYTWTDQPGPDVALLLNLTATMFVLGLLLLLIRRALPAESLGERVRVFKTGPWLKALIPLAMMSSLHLINQNTDLLMIGLFRSSAEVAHYKIAVSSAGLLTIGLTTVGVVSMPYVRRFIVEKDTERLQILAQTCAAVALAFSVPVFIVFFIWGQQLIGFAYGDNFIVAYLPMLILSVAQIVNASFGIVWALLVMSGNEKIGLMNLAVTTVINIILNFVLVPTYGGTGAAIATGISIIIWNILFWLATKKILNVDASLFGLFALLRRNGHDGAN